MPNIPKVSLEPELLTTLYGIPIHNGITAALTTTLIVIAISLWINFNIKLIPGKFQLIMESVVEFFYSRVEDLYETKAQAMRHSALVISLFIFIFISNQFTLIPLVQSILIEGKNIFIAPTAHLSQTLTLALVVVAISHFIAFTTAPIKHISNYIKIEHLLKIRSVKDIGFAFIEIFIGILDLVGEVAKVISLSCRLFGNVFAGQVMVAVIAGLSIYTQFLIPIPFYILGIFSGIIQALVFAFLAMAFISNTSKSVQQSV